MKCMRITNYTQPLGGVIKKSVMISLYNQSEEFDGAIRDVFNEVCSMHYIVT